MKILKAIFAWMSLNGPFILTLICIFGALGMAACKGGDLSLLPVLLGLYLGQTGARAISAHVVAGKDPGTNTAQVIREIEGTGPKD